MLPSARWHIVGFVDKHSLKISRAGIYSESAKTVTHNMQRLAVDIASFRTSEQADEFVASEVGRRMLGSSVIRLLVERRSSCDGLDWDEYDESNPSPALCYIHEEPYDDEPGIAFFTTQPIQEQWGEDWGGTMFGHSWGIPSKGPTREIQRVQFRCPALSGPLRAGLRSATPEKINRREFPWLSPANPNDTYNSLAAAWAGIGTDEFKSIIVANGGSIVGEELSQSALFPEDVER